MNIFFNPQVTSEPANLFASLRYHPPTTPSIMEQQYSLRWNNHQPNFINMFGTLLSTQTLVDVTLAAEGRHLQAHKIVLACCSSYFQSLFVDNPSRHPIVILKDVTFANLRTIVEFMYYGEVHVTEQQLTQVLDTAKVLKIKGLTEMPESTSVTRSQGTGPEPAPPAELQAQASADAAEPDARSGSPPSEPSSRRKRKSSTGSQSARGGEEAREDCGAAVDIVRNESIILPCPAARAVRRPDFQEPRPVDQPQAEAHNMNVEPLPISLESSLPQLPTGGQWGMMEHGYPRYTNACVGALQPDAGLYMNNVMAPHLGEVDMGEYAGGVPGPSPGPSCAPEAPPPPDQPPQQQPAKRRRTTNPQSEENFQRALEAVRFGGIGFCKAARMFGVNNRTLWLEYKKKGYPNNRPSIKSRIKREHTTPPPEQKEEAPPPEQQMAALICPPHPVSVGFIDSRPIDFPLQGVPHNSPLNILGVNFNSMQ